MMIRRLAECGIEAMYTREPGGTALGEEIRNVLQHNQAGEAPCERAELLLFEASRNQLVEKVIRPALAKGTWVICDRFMDSTTAYQGYGRGLPVDEVKAIHHFTVNDVTPDLTLLLDLEVETGFERIAQRFLELGESADRFEQEERSFHDRVRQGYIFAGIKGSGKTSTARVLAKSLTWKWSPATHARYSEPTLPIPWLLV